jgi:hypothetical protein
MIMDGSGMKFPPLAVLAAAAFVLLLALTPGSLRAEPKQPSQEESEDLDFAKSFIGKNYDDELEIEGWNNLGGGLVLPPIFVHHYQREDGTFLVLTSRELSRATATAPANYEVTDALIVPPPPSGVEFTISCVQGQDETLRFLGLAKGPESKEWWTEVRRAWEIALDSGKISSTKTKGVRCTNMSWGQ